MPTTTDQVIEGKLPSGLLRRPDIYVRQLGFDLALFDPLTRQLHMLNSTAAAIWHHIATDRTVKNIVEVLALNFDISDPEALTSLNDDVQYFIGVMSHLKLVVPDPYKATPYIDVSDVAAYIPDREIGTLSQGYARPSLKTFTLDELQSRFKLDELAVTRFSDTWHPEHPTPGVAKTVGPPSQ